MRSRAFALAATLVLSGCDLLFPELSGHPPDAALGDGSGAIPDGGAGPHLSGSLCALVDLRDFRGCRTGHGGGFRVTVEETRDVTNADAAGSFVLPLARALDTATVAAIDPTGGDAPTIVTVSLRGGVAEGLGLPLVSAQALRQAAAIDGFAIDASRGVVLAWAVDAKGRPVAGVIASTAAAAVGPLYEGGGPGELAFGNSTGARGALALFNLSAPTVGVTLAPPPSGALKADQFTLPIRPGAVTITTLMLPPRS